jgi:hypothetical protein
MLVDIADVPCPCTYVLRLGKRDMRKDAKLVAGCQYRPHFESKECSRGRRMLFVFQYCVLSVWNLPSEPFSL